ncbi:MAG: hypothetical protein ACUVTX_01545 [Bacteroidales bacterium]
MYHVISTGIAVAILYLICHFFYRAGFFSLADHRKIWNIILAVTFLITGMAGLILALKVTYKWENTFFTNLIKWHVETGIAFSFTGIIHLLWHLTYFRNLFKIENKSADSFEPDAGKPSAKHYAINLFFIGYLSSSVQFLLMREMLNVAGGYELVAGTFLASWLISSAAGSFYAGKSNIQNLKQLNTFFAFSPVLSLTLMILINRLYLNPGETPSFLVSIIFTLLVLFPFCFISGFVFIKVLLAARRMNLYNSGKSFSIETIGGITAGLTVTLFSSGILNTYQILIISIILFFLYLAMMYYKPDLKLKFIFISSGIIFILISIWISPDRFFRQVLLHGIKVEKSQDTPYGNITYGLYGNEQSTFYNHRIARWRNDEIEREENIHYAMLQHDKPESVLLISGDPASSISEVMKYHVAKIFYVERDPELVRAFIRENIPGKEIVSAKSTDAYRFIKNTSEKFDVVIMVLPPPSTLLLNRYYTKEFFEEIRNRLNEKGVFACTPGSAENYYNYQSALLYSVIYNTINTVFHNVLPVAGNKLFFIASDKELNPGICSLLEEKKIKNIYVSPDYLDDELIKRKSEEIISIIDRSTKINTLSRPVACFHFQSYNLTRDLTKIIPALIIMMLLFFFPVFTIKRGNFPIYSAAASLAGYEILTLMAIQSSAGNIYHLTGLIIAGIMGGLSAGAWFEPFFPGKNRTSFLMTNLLAFYLAGGLFINKIIFIDNPLIIVIVFLILGFIPSFFTGSLFRVLTEKTGKNQSPSRVYGSDLAGSALGFIAISGITIPLAGITGTLLIISALIFTGLIFALAGNK